MAKPRRIQWDEQAAGANARRELPALVKEYFAWMRAFLARDPPPAELHRARLKTKRLRYTLELFRPCYGPGLDTRLAALRPLQQVLGDLNDAVASGELLAKSMPASPERAQVERFLEERAAALAQRFRKDWSEGFDAPGQELWWCVYLARNARARKGAVR